MTEEEIHKIVAEKSKKLRELTDLTQEELATKVGLTRQTIIKIEKRRRPTRTQALALYKIFESHNDARLFLQQLEKTQSLKL